MEKPQIPIKDINSNEATQAMLREHRAMLLLPEFDLEGWLALAPVRVSDNARSAAQQAEYDEEFQQRYSAWLYSSPLPIEMSHWNILVEPKRPREMSVGGIIIAQEAIEAENFKTNIGRIIHVGDGAYRSTTTGGIDLKKLRAPKVGEHIVHKHYSGIEMIMAATGRRLRIMDDVDVVGWVKNPEDWRMYL